jgi:hypothetical protein
MFTGRCGQLCADAASVPQAMTATAVNTAAACMRIRDDISDIRSPVRRGRCRPLFVVCAITAPRIANGNMAFGLFSSRSRAF